MGREAWAARRSAAPKTQMPADQTSSSELMQKKLIVWPISSHDPAHKSVSLVF